MKKFLSIILAVSLSISMIGCNGKDNTSDADSVSAQVTNQEEQSTDKSVQDKENSEENNGEAEINISSFEFSKETEERLDVETEAATAINYYLVARLYLDEFLQYDIKSGSPEEYIQLLELTMKAFDNVKIKAEELEENALQLEVLESSETYKGADGTGKIEGSAKPEITDDFFFNPFIVDVYAGDESEAVKWAKDITERFDKAPVGKGIRTLADQMGTDAKHAYAQLKQAQDILAGATYEDIAAKADAAYKTAKVLKTAGTAAQLTLSIVTANPTSMVDAVMASGGILVNGINTMLEVGQTGSVLFVGDDNKMSQTLENIENALAPVGSALGLYSLSSNLLKGADFLKDTPAVADSIMYIGTSLNDYLSEGKIMGGIWTQGPDGKIKCTLEDTMTIKSAWAKTEEVLKNAGYTEEEIAKVKEAGEVPPTKYDPESYFTLEEGKSIEETMPEILPEADLNSEEAVEETEAESKESESTSEEDKSKNDESAEDKSTDSSSKKSSSDTDKKKDDNAGDKTVEKTTDITDTEEVNESKELSPIPDVSEVSGYYNFYVSMTMGDQSGEGYNPQTISNTGSNKLKMVDSTGYAVTGTYDPSTGKASFTDSDGTPIHVTFSRNADGSIKAVISEIADYGTMNGSATKK